jgi:hypothetical protein
MAIFYMATSEEDSSIPVKCPAGASLILDMYNFALRLFIKASGGLYRLPPVTDKHRQLTDCITRFGNQKWDSSPASNGKAERMHRTVLNMARCMQFSSGLKIHFCGDAMKYATYVLNSSPSRSNPERNSPLELLEGKPPSLLNIVAFGSTCTVHRDSKCRTLKKRAARGRILGIPEKKLQRLCGLPKGRAGGYNHSAREYIETLSSAQNAALLAPPSDDQDANNARNGEPVTPANQLGNHATNSRVSTRPPDLRKPSRRLRDALAACVENLEAIDEVDSVCNICAEDPLTYKAAMKSKHAKAWQDAVDAAPNCWEKSQLNTIAGHSQRALTAGMKQKTIDSFFLQQSN